MKNHFNEVFPSFDPINPELYPGNRIIDTHANYFSFHLFNKYISHNIKSCIQELDKIAIKLPDDPSSVLIVTDASIKNNIATFIVHIHVCDKPITKTLHHTLNITSIEAELFTIRCNINQATNIGDIFKIIVVIDSIHVVEKNFDLFFHFFQKHLASILKDLQTFFSYHSENHIEFREYSSYCNWHLHKVIDIETKSFKLTPIFLSKLSWDFSKKIKYDDLINK